MFTKCTTKWNGMTAKQRILVDEMETKDRMLWVMEIAGHTLTNMLVEAWKYLLPRNLLPDGFVIEPQYLPEVSEVKAENKMEIDMKVAGATIRMTAKTYLGNMINTAGNWSPNNFIASYIRAFMFSLGYGLDQHPGDTYPTTMEEVRAILHNLSSLTTCKSFWVVMFCREQDLGMVHQVMSESKLIRGEPESLVRHFTIYV
jgi:hypothetical protein